MVEEVAVAVVVGGVVEAEVVEGVEEEVAEVITKAATQEEATQTIRRQSYVLARLGRQQEIASTTIIVTSLMSSRCMP